MDSQFKEKAALMKYHATMLRRQLVRDLCVAYENIFDQAAERECKSIALPGAGVATQNVCLSYCECSESDRHSVMMAMTFGRDFYRQPRLSEPDCRRDCHGRRTTANCRWHLPSESLLCGIR